MKEDEENFNKKVNVSEEDIKELVAMVSYFGLQYDNGSEHGCRHQVS